MELVAQGAEARMYQMTLFGNACLVKERFSKAYRHAALDEKLTTKRTLQEARTLLRCREIGIPVPGVYMVDVPTNRIYLQYLTSTITAKQAVFDQLASPQQVSTSSSDSTVEASTGGLDRLAVEIGAIVAKLHSNNIIHGDLTTSNILLDQSSSTLYLIDFGLSYTSTLMEDKAVDLYVLERAFLSTHPTQQEMLDKVMAAYFQQVKQSAAIHKKLEEVRARGRKRTMLG